MGKYDKKYTPIDPDDDESGMKIFFATLLVIAVVVYFTFRFYNSYQDDHTSTPKAGVVIDLDEYDIEACNYVVLPPYYLVEYKTGKYGAIMMQLEKYVWYMGDGSFTSIIGYQDEYTDSCDAKRALRTILNKIDRDKNDAKFKIVQ